MAVKVFKIQFFLFFIIFCSCAKIERQGYQIRPTGDVDVKVSMGGQRIVDLEKQLVHRIDIPSKKLDLIKPKGSDALLLPFLLKKEIDQRGLVMGLRVFRNNNSSLILEDLGLKERDLLTAIGTKLLNSAKDFDLFVKILRNKGEVSLTLERDFQPHKILYYLSK